MKICITKHTVTRFSLVISLAIAVGLVIVIGDIASSPSSSAQKKHVTLTTVVDDQGDPPRLLNMLFQPAMQELRARHPDIAIQLDYRPIPYLNLHTQFLKAMANQTPVDIMSVDQIWLGEFVEKGFLADLTDRAKSWGREKDWYEANWDGGVYKDKIYGIWTVADLRGMWYWKDLLNKAGVDPNSLQTWDGYITSAKKLNAALRPQGIEGVHLVAAGHSPDMSFYPYLWMLGGDIIKQKDGHPTKGTYWFPAYNSTEGVRAMEFIKEQVNAGIKPQNNIFGARSFLTGSLQ
jgi:multiple sugar transport system substrate-binding protein